jgi:hypothetical protein
MLYKQTISPFLEETLIKLMHLEELNDYRLVGGTALSLLFGYRKSVDIDMFTANYCKSDELIQIMKKHFPRTEIRDLGFGVTLYIPFPDSDKELKVDLMCNEEYIRPYHLEEGIRIAQIEDLAAMKLEAITTRKEKKDYWDIAEILDKYSLEQMIGFYKERYPWNDLKAVMESLIIFNKCDGQFDPEVLNNKNWEDIKSIISQGFEKYIELEKQKRSKVHDIDIIKGVKGKKNKGI